MRAAKRAQRLYYAHGIQVSLVVSHLHTQAQPRVVVSSPLSSRSYGTRSTTIVVQVKGGALYYAFRSYDDDVKAQVAGGGGAGHVAAASDEGAAVAAAVHGAGVAAGGDGTGSASCAVVPVEPVPRTARRVVIGGVEWTVVKVERMEQQ